MTRWTFTALAVAHMARERISPGDMLGLLPAMLNRHVEDDAVTQLDRHYRHGGGWHDSHGFTLIGEDGAAPTLEYPGDPPLRCIARTELREERIYLFEASYVAVVQPGGAMRVARMD